VSAGPPPPLTEDVADESAPRFTFRQRLLLALARTLGPLLVRVIGMTLRVRITYAPGAIEPYFVEPAIYPFWHRCIMPAAYAFRNKRIAVLTSRSADGEYIAAIIERLGFKAVRGSSSRGGAAGLRRLQDEIAAGRAVAFTIDGPRGPRYVAKRGPVLLARMTGAPIIPFYVAVEDPWVLPSWDAFMIPKPFSRAVAHFVPPLQIAPGADDAEIERVHAAMQRALERVRDEAEAKLRAHD
jgi:lysophospholipid acyltransferase (LPLAT)-like uncharacterized protein